LVAFGAFVKPPPRADGKRFIVRADEKLSAFVELEREALTVTFYLESIRAEINFRHCRLGFEQNAVRLNALYRGVFVFFPFNRFGVVSKGE
jgi:hypothetical protein